MPFVINKAAESNNNNNNGINAVFLLRTWESLDISKTRHWQTKKATLETKTLDDNILDLATKKICERSTNCISASINMKTLILP